LDGPRSSGVVAESTAFRLFAGVRNRNRIN
jgi:hypothetical protein